jgi:hypothetical protein
LSYASPQVYEVGTAIAALDPTVTGTVASYTVSPALPAGLSLDGTTGRISGTPTAATRSTHTISATNSGGSATFALQLTVLQERAMTDRPDEKTGLQVHVVYVLPSDGVDEQLDRTGTLESSARIWNAWFSGQTGGKELRLDTHAGGKLDVSFLRLDKTDADMNVAGGNVRTKLEYQLLARGFDSVDKVYLAYYGGDGDGCGRGAWPPTLHGNVGAVYIGAAAGCTAQPFATGSQPPGFLEHLALHEVLHVLGFAATCSPHHTESGHVSDSAEDLMYSGAAAWRPSILDVNHDDYYGSAVPGCRDVANSAFLETLPAGAEPPPGWPYANLADLDCVNEATTTPGPEGADTQVIFVNTLTVGGAPATVTVWERTLNTTTGLYARTFRATVPYNDGIVVPAKENAVLVATATGGTCRLMRAAANPSRFLVKP